MNTSNSSGGTFEKSPRRFSKKFILVLSFAQGNSLQYPQLSIPFSLTHGRTGQFLSTVSLSSRQPRQPISSGGIRMPVYLNQPSLTLCRSSILRTLPTYPGHRSHRLPHRASISAIAYSSFVSLLLTQYEYVAYICQSGSGAEDEKTAPDSTTRGEIFLVETGESQTTFTPKIKTLASATLSG